MTNREQQIAKRMEEAGPAHALENMIWASNAAVDMEYLLARVAKMEAALKPFADCADPESDRTLPTYNECVIAREALEK